MYISQGRFHFTLTSFCSRWQLWTIVSHLKEILRVSCTLHQLQQAGGLHLDQIPSFQSFIFTSTPTSSPWYSFTFTPVEDCWAKENGLFLYYWSFHSAHHPTRVHPSMSLYSGGNRASGFSSLKISYIPESTEELKPITKWRKNYC